MNHYIDPNWRQVEKDAFTEFLKTCPDWMVDRFCNGTRYRFRHGAREFAFELDGGLILVDPALLK